MYDENIRAKTPLDDFILRSALRVKDINIAHRIKHALRLKDLDMARQVLNSKAASCHCLVLICQAVSRSDLQKCLMHALEERNAVFVKLLLDFEASPALVIV